MVRAVLPTVIALGVAFALGAAAGFVVAHDPGRDTVRVLVESERPAAEGGADAVIAGEVARSDGSRLVIDTDRGSFEVELGGVALEELARPGGAGLEVGETVNIGGEQTPFGLALSGVVAIEAATP